MADQNQSIATHDAEAEEKSRLRRPRGQNVVVKRLLDAPERPGFVRRFVVNTPARVAEMERLGYQLAADKAGEGNARTSGIGTRIERLSGKNEDHSAQSVILMETPIEEYNHGVRDKMDALKPFEEAIRAGRDTQNRLKDAYIPSDTSSIS